MKRWDHIGIGMGNKISELLQQANDFTSMLFDVLSMLSLYQQQMLEFMEETKHNILGGFRHNFDLHCFVTKDTFHKWSCMRRVKPHAQNVEYPTSWETLPAGVIQSNVDTAIFHNNSVGFGMCFQNSKDHFLMGKSATYTPSYLS